MYYLPYDLLFFFFNDTATTEIYTLSLHDALPISLALPSHVEGFGFTALEAARAGTPVLTAPLDAVDETLGDAALRSEEHTSELQSRQYLVCRLLLEKKKKKTYKTKTNQ